MLPFDEAVALYRRDAEAFEKYRLGEIDKALTSIRERRGETAERKAKALQWKIDVIRNRWHAPNTKRYPTEKDIANNQMVVLQKINAMMADNLKELGARSTELLEELKRGNTY